MRCISPLKNTLNDWGLLLTPIAVLITIGFPSFTMAENRGLPANTASLIQHYKQQHPVNIEKIQQQVKQRIKAITKRDHPTMHIEHPTHVTLSLYPIVSKQLTPGKVESRNLHLNVNKTIFLIGYDKRSLAWLKRYAKRLTQLQATGFIVNVQNSEQTKQLQHCIPNVRLHPLPADSLAQLLQLHHYPVLISQHLIEQ